MLTKEQRKQALDAYRTHCTGIVSDYEWPAEDDWLFCWDLATQAAVVRVVPEDSLAQPYADPWVPSFTGISTEAPALGDGKDCPHCPNQGWYSYWNPDTGYEEQ